MASTRWGGDPLPIGNQAALVPADLKRLADSMDGRTVHVALDAADRDARFVSLPKGALVTTPDADKAVWMKLADGVNSWSLVANDTGWVTSGFSPASGWAINECRVRVVNGWAALEIYVNRTGADITMSGFGGVTDTPIVTLPSAFWPSHKVTLVLRGSSYGFEGDILPNNGVVNLVSGSSNAVLVSGTNITASAAFLVD